MIKAGNHLSRCRRQLELFALFTASLLLRIRHAMSLWFTPLLAAENYLQISYTKKKQFHRLRTIV